jgi:thiol:disulfide interchange protein DsbD
MEPAMTRTETQSLLAPLCAAVLASLTLVAAAVVPRAHAQNAPVEVSLVADVDAIAPGVPFRLGLRFEIAEGWYINWLNPGDVGLAPSVAWSAPDGFASRHMEWPHPNRYRAGRSVVFGYAHSAVVWTEVTPPVDLKTGKAVTFRADAAWFACGESFERGEARPLLSIPVAEQAGAPTAYAGAQARLPRPPPFDVSATVDEDAIVIELLASRAPPGAAEPESHHPVDVFFFPFRPGIIENGAEQELRRVGGGYELRVERSLTEHARPARLAGVLVSRNGWTVQGHPLAVEVDVPLDSR